MLGGGGLKRLLPYRGSCATGSGGRRARCHHNSRCRSGTGREEFFNTRQYNLSGGPPQTDTPCSCRRSCTAPCPGGPRRPVAGSETEDATRGSVYQNSTQTHLSPKLRMLTCRSKTRTSLSRQAVTITPPRTETTVTAWLWPR